MYQHSAWFLEVAKHQHIFLLSEVLFIKVSFAMPSKDSIRKRKIVLWDEQGYLTLGQKEKNIKNDRSKYHSEDYYTDISAS